MAALAAKPAAVNANSSSLSHVPSRTPPLVRAAWSSGRGNGSCSTSSSHSGSYGSRCSVSSFSTSSACVRADWDVQGLLHPLSLSCSSSASFSYSSQPRRHPVSYKEGDPASLLPVAALLPNPLERTGRRRRAVFEIPSRSTSHKVAAARAEAARTASPSAASRRLSEGEQLGDSKDGQIRVETQNPSPELLLPRKNLVVPLAAPERRLRVGVDVDEVLARFLYALNTFCNIEHDGGWRLEDYFIYDFKTIWKCDQEEANHRVHSFFDSHHFFEGILPIPGARDALDRLYHHCDLVVVTSRQHVIQEPTLEWLEKHFPQLFQEVHFGNHYALSGASRSKSEICKELDLQVLIDDNPKYAVECAGCGIEVLLFDWENNYAWSKTEDGPSHPLIKRVYNWDDVESHLLTRVEGSPDNFE